MRPESLEDYAGVVARRGLLAALIAVLLGGTVVAVGLRMPRSYSSTAVVEVEGTQASPTAFLPNAVQTVLGSGADPVMLQTLIGRLTARAVLTRVLTDFDAAQPIGARILPPIAQLAKRVQASVETGTRLIYLKVDLREAEGGARNASLLANQLVETFRHQLAEEEAVEKRRDAQTQLGLIREQMEQLDERLDGLNGELLEFAGREGNPTLWGAELQHLFARRENLIEERSRTDAAREAVDVTADEANQALEAAPNMVLSGRSEAANPLHNTIAGQILAHEALAAQRVGAGASDDAPDVRGLEAARGVLESKLATVPDSVSSEVHAINPVRDWLIKREVEGRIERVRTEQEIGRLDQLLKVLAQEIDERAAEIPASEVRLDILRGEAASVRAVYEDLLLRGSRMEIALGAAAASAWEPSRLVGGIAMVDSAHAELRPIRPRVAFVLLTGVSLGLVVGLGVGFVFEWHSGADRIQNAAEAA